MGIDTDIVGVLRDLIQFLETLTDVNLPNDLQKVRDNLLQRSRISLVAAGQHSTITGPYLEMNAGKGKGLHLIKTTDDSNVNDENQITEYIYADNSNESRVSCQDYYEPFLTNVTVNSDENLIKRKYDDPEDELKSIYRTFSSEQTMSKAIKFGPLHLKEERRLFGFQLFSGFDQLRPCFIGLVGTHLLFYAAKHDKHPSDIISIRGYLARASPNAIPRDLERSKSTFEIFSPGNKTFQFTARSPKEMEQWIAVICRAGNATTVPVKIEFSVINPTIMDETTTKSVISVDSTCSEEQYQDVGCANNEKQPHSNKISDLDTNNDIENEVILRNEQKSTTSTSTDRSVIPPPLPARIPRRLPSLPHEHSSSNFDSIDDGYDEDDIYHKIEDLKEPTSTYQNLKNANHNLHTDDNQAELKRNDKTKSKTKKNKNKQVYSSTVEIYDDAQSAEISKSNPTQNDRASMTYDDIQIIVNDARKEIVKETRKKSFLDRVRYKKKLKQNNLNSNRDVIQCGTSQESLPYDDAMGLGIDTKQNNNDDMGEYTCPPAPRAVYGRPPAIVVTVAQNANDDFYDDIGVFQKNRDEKLSNQLSQVSTVESSHSKNDENSSRFALNLLQLATTMTKTNSQDETEHYQVPRLQDPIDIPGQVEDVAPLAEELYDDIAIVANFRTRQRDSMCSNSSLTDKMHTSTNNVIKVWNRFASGRKLKVHDLLSADKNK